MLSWHDFHIIGYSVESKRQTLTFNLEWPYETATDIQKVKLYFSGIESYYLEHDLGGNIVYSFAEVPLRPFLEHWANRFENECKWGWPRFWRSKPYPVRPAEIELEEAFEYLTQRQLKCVELSSSYGLSGWVLAQSSHHVPVEA